MSNQEMEADLRRSVLFSGLPSFLLHAISVGAETAVLSRGQKLWSAGDMPTRVGLVLSGRLKSVRAHDGGEAILDVAMPGDVLGDVAFAVNEPYSTAVISLRRSRVLLLPASVLRKAFAHEPRALSAALFSLAKRAQRLMRLVEGLAAGSVERRLASALVFLAERAGEPFPGGQLVTLRLRRAELAALAATSAESVSRYLVDWQRQGLLTVLPAGYLIRDLDALVGMAGSPGRGRLPGIGPGT